MRASDACVMARCLIAAAAGLDVVAGSTSYCWGVGSRPSSSQVQRFEQQCSQLSSALQQQGGPFLCGPQPSLVSACCMPDTF
jgi:hypothetical protein